MSKGLPILLLGGAAVLLLRGRKKKKKKPSKSTILQGECDPLDPSTWGTGNVCVEAGGTWVTVPAASLKECDPLDQSTWGAGNMCVEKDGRWVSVPAALQDECDPLDSSTWGSGNMCVIKNGRWVSSPAVDPPPPAEPSPGDESVRRLTADQRGEYKGDSGYVYEWRVTGFSSAPLWQWIITKILPEDADIFCVREHEVAETLEDVRSKIASGEFIENDALLMLSTVCPGLKEDQLRELLETGTVSYDSQVSGAADTSLNAYKMVSDAIAQSEADLKG